MAHLVRDYLAPDGRVLRISVVLPAELPITPAVIAMIDADFEHQRQIELIKSGFGTPFQKAIFEAPGSLSHNWMWADKPISVEVNPSS